MRSHENVTEPAGGSTRRGLPALVAGCGRRRSSARLRVVGAAMLIAALAVLTTSQAAAPPAKSTDSAPADNGAYRISDPAYLHAALRKRTGELIDMAAAQGLTVYYYVTYLEPQAQHARFVAHASADDAWSSAWQYGVVTTILPNDGKGWDMHPGQKVQQQLKSIALKVGLQQEGTTGELAPFTFVVPGTSVADLRTGKYPDGGGKTWVKHLNAMISAWGTQLPHAPPLATLPASTR